MIIDYGKHNTKKDLFNFLVKNKESLIAQKKSIIKQSSGFNFISEAKILVKDKEVYKANNPVEVDKEELNVIPVINTTNLFDNHLDVHLKGIWNKSIKENRRILHVREHQSQRFDYIISSGKDLKAFVENLTWKQLGFDFKGTTEALIFDSIVNKKRNPFMFDQYAKGWVTEHSVGMIYSKIILGINDEDFETEFEVWKKYSSEIVNLQDAEEVGFAWFVKEAKVIEGSAVPLGSNFATPTLEVKKGYEPSKDTHNEPGKSTQFDSINYIKNFNFK